MTSFQLCRAGNLFRQSSIALWNAAALALVLQLPLPRMLPFVHQLLPTYGRYLMPMRQMSFSVLQMACYSVHRDSFCPGSYWTVGLTANIRC